MHAPARLADDWPAQRQACLDVLCGYLRTRREDERDDDQVRRAITSALAAHLRRDSGEPSWSDLRVDLAGAHLVDVDLTGAVFSRRARFAGAAFTGTCVLDGVTFEGARTSRARGCSTGYCGWRAANRGRAPRSGGSGRSAAGRSSCSSGPAGGSTSPAPAAASRPTRTSAWAA
ncbi:pentapeptide repeat-containing protein [Saccharothrix lopnurensis]|uniref:Pentapeptide repeat-containing protein n=1 Tax=Saccharothrix lopnurensis TaxID=1670621 RepID=A0ABW1NYL5_9PSEU